MAPVVITARDPSLQSSPPIKSQFSTEAAVGLGITGSVSLIVIVILVSRYRRMKLALQDVSSAASQKYDPIAPTEYSTESTDPSLHPLERPPLILSQDIQTRTRNESPVSYRYLTNIRLHIARSIRTATSSSGRRESTLSTNPSPSRNHTASEAAATFRHSMLAIPEPQTTIHENPIYVDPWQHPRIRQGATDTESIPLMREETHSTSHKSFFVSEPDDLDQQQRQGFEDDKPDRYTTFHGGVYAVETK